MKSFKIVMNYFLSSMDRFEKYIQEIEENTTCDQFLEVNKKFISQITKQKKSMGEWKIHKALSNIKRFMIYKLLERKSMCTCALAKVFSVSDGTITHHLKILEKAGLVMGKKEGYFTRYYTTKNMVTQLTQTLPL
jgi:ArsR family transcriptional regulator